MAHLKFLGYKVVEMSFKVNNDAVGEKNFKINPKIKMDLRQGKDNLLVSTIVTIDKHQPSPTPFELTVNIVANFAIENPADINTLRLEASNIIFPYVRSTVSGLTVNANIPAYFLPTINFDSMSGSKQAKSGESIIIGPVDENI